METDVAFNNRNRLICLRVCAGRADGAMFKMAIDPADVPRKMVDPRKIEF